MGPREANFRRRGVDKQARLRKLIAPPFNAVLGDILSGAHRHYWLLGGRGSGKSSFVSLAMTEMLSRRPMANAVIFRKTEATLRDSVAAQTMWALEQMGMEEHWDYISSRGAFEERATGRLILTRGLDKPVRTKGLKPRSGAFEILWFEELAEFRGMDEILTATASVIRGCDRPVCFATFNPPGSPGHWLNREAARPSPDRFIHRSDYRDMPPEWLGTAFIAQAEAIRERDEAVWRRMYLGETGGDDGAVFPNVTLRAVSQAEIASMDRIWNGLDFGFGASPDALVRVGYDAKRRTVTVFEEFWGIRVPSDSLAEAVRERCGRAAITCDNAEPRMIDTLRSRGVNAMPARKGPGSVTHGTRWLADRLSIVIDPARCPNAAREFTTYQYGKDRFGNIGAEPSSGGCHAIDACRYALEEVMSERAGRVFRKD
ncbi:MAG: phage terminase large subunit [Oscillospiraceae bacterium]|nr:phage terminase large subunit [Oscillospiraceae bacterium]